MDRSVFAFALPGTRTRRDFFGCGTQGLVRDTMCRATMPFISSTSSPLAS